MFAKDFRQKAWTDLKGKWGTFAIIFLIYFLIIGALEGIGGYDAQNPVNTVLIGILSCVSFVLSGPFEFGLRKTSLMVANNETIKVENLFNGFKDFARTFSLHLINSVFIFLWSLLFIIPGIIKALSYSMSYFILQENPNLSANEARKESMRLMEGNKWRLFCLMFSFIGWILLSVLTLGILMIWINPYMYVAEAEFYKNLKEENGEVSIQKAVE